MEGRRYSVGSGSTAPFTSLIWPGMMEQSFYLEIYCYRTLILRYDMLIIYVNQEEKKLKPTFTWNGAWLQIFCLQRGKVLKATVS